MKTKDFRLRRYSLTLSDLALPMFRSGVHTLRSEEALLQEPPFVLKRRRLQRWMAPPPWCVAEDFILKILLFHPQDKTIKDISGREISSFLRRRNFAVVYCNWNSLLSINHIKGKGLGDISSWHVLAWVNEKPSRADRHCLREIISSLWAVCQVVKLRGGGLSFKFSKLQPKPDDIVLSVDPEDRGYSTLSHSFHPPTSPWAHVQGLFLPRFIRWGN